LSLTLHKIDETYRRERLSADGSTSENDIRIVVLVNAEETSKGRLVSETTGKFQPEG
jgi:hypothetical protein